MMVDICHEARGSRNAGGEQKSDRNNGDQICTAQIKSRNEGVMTSEHDSYAFRQIPCIPALMPRLKVDYDPN